MHDVQNVFAQGVNGVLFSSLLKTPEFAVCGSKFDAADQKLTPWNRTLAAGLNTRTRA